MLNYLHGPPQHPRPRGMNGPLVVQPHGPSPNGCLHGVVSAVRKVDCGLVPRREKIKVAAMDEIPLVRESRPRCAFFG